MKLKSRLLFAFGTCLLAFASISPASEDVRLSRTLIPSEYADAGLKQLSSDQVAILDALVRRDTTSILRGAAADSSRPARFSERLSADERSNAGLTLLSEDEVAKLDQYVARLTAPIGSSTGSFAAGQPMRRTVVSEKSLRRPPEIHGMISLVYGVGSGGYSERGGAMVLTYDDPSGISLAVGYSEIRSKGGYFLRDYHDRFGYRDRYGYRDGFGPRLW